MEPPSYDEASRHPPFPLVGGINGSSSPDYRNSTSAPSTPPPSYREAVHPDAFPVLTPLSAPNVVNQPSRNSGATVHPLTRIGERAAVSSRQTQPVVVSQPQPVAISVTSLRDAPALTQCPHCQHLVTTKVKYVPGWSAWCTCVMLALLGLICGFCLIPLWTRRLQDAHHFCPDCGKPVHVYER